MSTGRLQDKVAIVTGAGRGIGKAIALAFAREGADLTVVSRTLVEVEQTAKEIRNLGRMALALKVDVSKYDDVVSMVREVLETFGRIDILVNNAGIEGVPCPAVEKTLEMWNKTIAVDLIGVFICSQVVGREMIKRRSGKIINISSIGGLFAMPFSVEYCAAKHGVIGLTKTLAVEWGKYNINVNCICPGLTNTQLVQRLRQQNPELIEARIRRIPLGRIAEPEDIAKAAVFLASSDADYITGAVLCVDGGISALHPGYTIDS